MTVNEQLSNEPADQLLTTVTPARQVFNTVEAAQYLRVSKQYLELLRVQGGGPRYAKLSRAVRYRRAALDDWLIQHERNHTADEP